MKNISRRVFIKGMAVAAAATAASTVLAGCNFVPGTDETVVVPGFQPVTKTLTIGEESVDVTVTKYGITTTGSVVADLTVVNNTESQLTLVNNGVGAKCIDVSAYFDSKYSDKKVVTIAGGKNIAKANEDGASYKLETSATVTDVPEKWNTLTLVFVLQLGTETQEISFNLSK